MLPTEPADTPGDPAFDNDRIADARQSYLDAIEAKRARLAGEWPGWWPGPEEWWRV